MPSWRVFIDAGAGNGQITSWFIEKFQRTIVIEPNPSFRDELRRTCLTAEVLPEMILEVHLPDLADLILCSHVFYHIDSAAWMPHLEKPMSWLSSDGMLVVVLQNHDTDCMRMLDYFSGQRFALSELARRFQAAQGNHYQVDFETVPAQITTMDLDSAYLIAAVVPGF